MSGAGSTFRGPLVVSAAVGVLVALVAWVQGLPPDSLPRLQGAGWMLLAALAVATFASEDLACVAAGWMVAHGEAGFGSATVACFLGIFLGDLGLFAAGRVSGGALRGRLPFLRRLDASLLQRTSRWLDRHGPWIVVTSRFLPGTRLPTYVGAGALGAPALPFAFWFAAACAVWTPLLVGVSVLAAKGILRGMGGAGPWTLGAVAAGGTFGALVALRALPSALTRRGRARWRSSWTRLRRWEFWPIWIVYAPLLLTWWRLGRRHGGITVFTAANPAMPSGGFIGESKAEILAALERGGAPVARFVRIPVVLGTEARFRSAVAFLEESGGGFPAVVKPDVGERGDGVRIVHSLAELRDALDGVPFDVLVQEYVPGPELGIFWVRRPDEPRGRILSVTAKHLPVAVGDGRRTLEEILLTHPDGPGRLALWFDRFGHRLGEVLAEGETIVLSPIGNHCRGAVFRDGASLVTPALTVAVERIARSLDGFYFGRFDLRAPSLEEFQAGSGLRVLELNGVTSEGTHIYDPSWSLADARRFLREQWTLAYEIGAANRDRGADVTPPRELAQGTFRFLF